MARVRVTIAGVSREVGLWHMRFPMAGAGAFSSAQRVGGGRGSSDCSRNRMLALHPLRAGGPWPIASEQGDRAQRIERLRQRLGGGPARVKPRPGRTIDRRWRTEQALRRALIAERSRLKGAKDALAKERPDDSGELR